MTNPRRFLFVCVENSCRSQMAEAYARMQGAEAFSAGSRPSGEVNPKAVATMREVGYDLAAHRSKSFTEVPDVVYDAVVAMGCGDSCASLAARSHLEWEIPDPKHMDPAAFRSVRDEIGRRVRDLAT